MGVARIVGIWINCPLHLDRIENYCVGHSNVDSKRLIPHVLSHLESLDFNLYMCKHNVFRCDETLKHQRKQ